MKKIFSLIILSIMIMMICVNVFATNSVLGDDNATTITGNEYENAQKNVLSNNNTSKLPQTGAEDYVAVIMCVVCVAGAMFAYKKVSDYKEV